MKKGLGMIGFLAFLIGIILAIVAGIFWPENTIVILILLILGIIIGFLNVSDKETLPFLVATIALIVVGGVFAPITALSIGEILDQILRLVAALMAPAAIIIAVKSLYTLAKPGEK
jgi:hypothetical protein